MKIASKTGPTPNPIKKAIACAVVAFVAIYAGLRLSFGPPDDPAHIAGMVAGLVVVPAIIVGLWARNSAKTWSLFRVIAFYVLFLVISAAIFISGSVSNPQH
jgi:CDP-diglyceride synthetase